MSVQFFTLENQFKLSQKRLFTRWVKDVISSYSFSCGTISFIFTGNEKILAINQQFLGHNYYTDIITFNYNQRHSISGDIYISIDTVRSNANIYKVTFEEELHRVMIHGILHLIGFNDKSKNEKLSMRQQEDLNLGMLYAKYLLK